jgi:hypothetical protein
MEEASGRDKIRMVFNAGENGQGEARGSDWQRARKSNWY